jgi:predicted transcriptional regulator
MNEKIKDRYMTIRLPADVERELRKMAERHTRTLAAQILHCIKMELKRQQAQETKA